MFERQRHKEIKTEEEKRWIKDYSRLSLPICSFCFLGFNQPFWMENIWKKNSSKFWTICAGSYLYSINMATWCEELTHWKRLWCWEGLGAGGEGDDRGWDGWMASLTRWTWVWVNSGNWWWTGRPGMLQFMGSQRVGHDWATELNWTLYLHLFT